jgi:hypothetical protein
VGLSKLAVGERSDTGHLAGHREPKAVQGQITSHRAVGHPLRVGNCIEDLSFAASSRVCAATCPVIGPRPCIVVGTGDVARRRVRVPVVGRPGCAESRPDRQCSSALRNLPLIGDQIRENVDSLDGSLTALGVGILVALYGALGVTHAAQYTLNRVWRCPRQHARASSWCRHRPVGGRDDGS